MWLQKNLNYICIYSSHCNSIGLHNLQVASSLLFPTHICRFAGPQYTTSISSLLLAIPSSWKVIPQISSRLVSSLSSVVCYNDQKELLWLINLRWPPTWVYTHYLYLFQNTYSPAYMYRGNLPLVEYNPHEVKGFACFVSCCFSRILPGLG